MNHSSPNSHASLLCEPVMYALCIQSQEIVRGLTGGGLRQRQQPGAVVEAGWVAHVMTVKRSEKLWGLTEKGPCQVGADRMCQVQRGQWDQGAEGLPLGYRGYMAPAGAGQGATGCRPVAICPTQANWPATSVMARRERPWRNRPRSPIPGGPSRRPKSSWDLTSTRYAGGTVGSGTSSWRCCRRRI